MISYFYLGDGRLNNCEDSLTSLTFDLLKYLPDELFWHILKDALIVGHLPDVTHIEQLSFWEHWDATDTSNTNFIEPDVFLRTENIDVIIEAKRWNENQQCNKQKKEQIIAYFNEFGVEGKQLYFIQLGGLFNRNPEDNFHYKTLEVIICKTNWSYMLQSVVKHYNMLDKLNLKLFNPQKRVMEDIIKGFELHQFYTLKWLGELAASNISTHQFDYFNFTSDKKEKLKKPLKNLVSTNIRTTTTNKLFEYAKPAQ